MDNASDVSVMKAGYSLYGGGMLERRGEITT
jgi:hypothetical protein